MKLPPRMTCNHVAFYHRSYRSTPEGRRQVWVRLGSEYSVAIKRYATHSYANQRISRILSSQMSFGSLTE